MIQAKIDPKYEVVRKLREGGMGAIFLVRHRLLDELRVVKVLRSQLTNDEDLKQRFLREARIAIQLRHPNVAQLYDFSVDDEGTAYIVLEYIDGITFEEFARQPEARHLALTLALAEFPVYMRLLRADMITTLQQDFILVARAKGLGVTDILLGHALRPSSLSLLAPRRNPVPVGDLSPTSGDPSTTHPGSTGGLPPATETRPARLRPTA